jgi:hypothetical protein
VLCIGAQRMPDNDNVVPFGAPKAVPKEKPTDSVEEMRVVCSWVDGEACLEAEGIGQGDIVYLLSQVIFNIHNGAYGE